MNPITYHIIAIDISKATLEVLSDKNSFSIENTSSGLKKLEEHISLFKHPLVVFEATGGYERSLMESLNSQKAPFAMLNPSRVRYFAKSEGLKAKTDPIDARMILRFARAKEIRPTSAMDPHRQLLADLMDRRSHLTEQIAREKNRLQNSSKNIHSSIQKMLKFANKELSAIETRIRTLIKSKNKLKSISELCLSISGVGEITAWTLLAHLAEIEHLNRNQLVALVGIAPFNNDSGKTSKRRRIQEGRAKVRKCLYMAAKTAAIHNEVIKEYVDKLRARGKPYKCAIVAAMRKLLLHIQSIIKKHNLTLAS